MKQILSKYDVLNDKMNKFSKTFLSFIGLYKVTFSFEKKCLLVEDFIEKVLCDAHIIFEIKNDSSNYLMKNGSENIDLSYMYRLETINRKLEKVLLLEIIYKNKDKKFIYDVIEVLEQKKDENDLIAMIYGKLEKEDREILKIVTSKDYTFDKLPQQYQALVLKSHKYFMDNNINPYVNKIESEEVEFFKGMKIFNKNVDMNFTFDSGYSRVLKR